MSGIKLIHAPETSYSIEVKPTASINHFQLFACPTYVGKPICAQLSYNTCLYPH